ncbi:MAG: acyltransferase [Bacteroidia bacterium]|nr:acyltransferase [Bacteroidia bacterium]
MNNVSITNLDQMDLLRVVGILIVVLRHCFAPYTNSWDVSEFYEYNEAADFIGKYISTISMPLFVFISGYIYSYLRNALNKYPNYKILVSKKTRRLLIPYVVFAPLYIYFFLDFNSTLSFMKYLWTGSGHLWFLLMMFILFLMFYNFEDFFKKKLKFGFGISLLLYALVLPMHYIEMNPFAHVFKYFIFFYLGYVFLIHHAAVISFLKGKAIWLFIAHAVLFTVYFYVLKNSDGILLISLVKQGLLILSLLSLGFIYSFLDDLFKKLNDFLTTCRPQIKLINKNSYYIYIFHQPILQLFFGIALVQKLPITVVVISSFIVAVLLSLLLSILVQKTKLGKNLIGA